MTTQIVADEQDELDRKLGKFARQQNDWFRRVREGSLDPEEIAHAVQPIINRGAAVFKYDKRKNGWKLLEHVPRGLTSVSDLELVPFLKSGESSIRGEELVRRSRLELNTNYGQEDAEWLLEHESEIPAEFRPFYLVFTGTVWGDAFGRRSVAYLYFFGERWLLFFYWLGGGFLSVVRLVRPRKV